MQIKQLHTVSNSYSSWFFSSSLKTTINREEKKVAHMKEQQNQKSKKIYNIMSLQSQCQFAAHKMWNFIRYTFGCKWIYVIDTRSNWSQYDECDT